ncbi:MAG TPA: endonuclease/exonuclease/phosphatase family protein [Kofleriaceae bacterium]|nr:endonuclease/exonuclease/phosphatase family protein [Kofleriaceae bacterium]
MSIARALVTIAAAGLVLVGALLFVPLWPCTLLEHFRVQYLLGGSVIVAAAFAFASRWFDAALIALLVDLVAITSDLSATAHVKQGTPVRVLYANVLTSNTRHAELSALIATTAPDVVALLETDRTWFEALAPALAGYERIEYARNDNFGLALYVRGTLEANVEYPGGYLPAIVAHVTLSKGPQVSFVVAHPAPPITSEAEAHQHDTLAAIAARVGALRAPVVLAGDLNATPWSRVFRKLVGTTGLCDTRAGFGYQGSFPASSVVLRIPIDHVLVSCDIGVANRTLGPDVGSDHLPVIADLVF